MTENVSQVPIEAVVLSDNSNARVTQVSIEAVTLPNTARIYISQFIMEVITPNNPISPMSIVTHWQWIMT